ncbi:MAG: hypothetical protein US89_C0010G0013 [Candidatus Peregrinibacteria bacterium GW2011_GWF2_38_29]|nr:MAG: hypothetical protein US89_C0010G0013 [Candidatus Peregrinibacteria bacterium GW2011_GWF2_38_29]HBB02364.1 hypothetical protein [Candidatus Peregrinibacteria bacterium]
MKLSQVILLSGLALGGAVGCEAFQAIEKRCPEIKFNCNGKNTEGCAAAGARCESNNAQEDLVRDIRYGINKDLLLLLIVISSGMAIREALRLHKDKEK